MLQRVDDELPYLEVVQVLSAEAPGIARTIDVNPRTTARAIAAAFLMPTGYQPGNNADSHLDAYFDVYTFYQPYYLRQ